MICPEMIFFDYGQTLIDEIYFDGLKGTEAVMKYAVANKHGYTAQDVQLRAEELNREVGRFDPQRRHLMAVEVPNAMFAGYLYQSMGIQLSISGDDLDRVFWDAASPGRPTEGIERFLRFLRESGIRTGVISNICYSPGVVKERISTLLPDHTFEYVIPTSGYMFRKPNRRIFDLALEMADIEPEKVWYIGDNYLCDVEGAINAGMFPVWYTGAISQPDWTDPTVLTVSDWLTLENIISGLEKSGGAK